MFGTYKGHEVISLEEANVKLRKDLDLALRQGTLKVENIQNVLLGTFFT
jgi:adenine deaminase